MLNFDYDLQSVQETRHLARQAKQAQTELAQFNSEQIDQIIRNMVKTAEENAVSLAKLAVEETGFGKVEDKIFKNRFASTELYQFIKPMQTIGVIKEDKINKVLEIAEPWGCLWGSSPQPIPPPLPSINRLLPLNPATELCSRPILRPCNALCKPPN